MILTQLILRLAGNICQALETQKICAPQIRQVRKYFTWGNANLRLLRYFIAHTQICYYGRLIVYKKKYLSKEWAQYAYEMIIQEKQVYYINVLL